MAAIGWQRHAVLHHYHAPIVLVDAFLAVMVVVMVLCPKEDQEGGRADVQSPFLFSLHISVIGHGIGGNISQLKWRVSLKARCWSKR